MNERDRFEVQSLIEARSIPEPNSGCWLWMGACDRDGYGSTKWRGVNWRAHRLSFEATHGGIPLGFMVMHSCNLSNCVNPDHLSVGTGKDNLSAAGAAGRMRNRFAKDSSWLGRQGVSLYKVVPHDGTPVSAASLRTIVTYDPETGAFTWLPRPLDLGWTTKNAGRESGWIDTSIGYRRMTVFGQIHLAHRLVWLYVHGRFPARGVELDHVNGDKSDNRLCNLREASHTQNGFNTGLRKNNTSGFKGVTWSPSRARWEAKIDVDGKTKRIGRYKTIEEAAEARRAFIEAHHGDFVFRGVN